MEIPDNFGALEKEFSDYEKSKVVVLPVPYDYTRSWVVGESWGKMDASQGPKAIISASKNMELYDVETDKTIAEIGIHTLPELRVERDAEKNVGKIEQEINKHLKKNKFIVMLGGEHSISTGAVRACHKKFPEMSVLQLDAHSDLREEFEEGGEYSHAAVMSRITEICPAVQVGIRSMSDEEAEKIKKGNFNIFYAKDIHDNDGWMDKAISKLSNEVYITIDLDVFDPSIMPSVGTPEPGGLGWYQILKFLKKLSEKKKIISFDVVELAPTENIAPDFLAAKLIYKLIGYVFNK